MKCKLPKDWIAVNSKSHPDRVYYFNVKTNQSSWVHPTLDKVDKTSLVNGSKSHKEKDNAPVTIPESNIEENEILRGHSSDKINPETPQARAIRAKMLERLGSKSKSISTTSSDVSCAKKIENKQRDFCPRSSSSKTKDDESITSQNKNNNVTPQMKAISERIQRRISNEIDLNKTPREIVKNKQQSCTTNQKSSKTSVSQKSNTEYQKSFNSKSNKNRNIKELRLPNVSKERERKSFLKKNLAKERMQRLRKSLSNSKEKFNEMCRAHLVNKNTSLKSSKSLSSSCDNDSLELCIYKNSDIRLKRLHNKILKNAAHEKNTTLNCKPQNQQNNEPVTENMTKDKLIEKAEQEVLYEEMDWEPMKDEEITLQVEMVRTQLNKDNYIETNYVSENIVELSQPSKIEGHEKSPLYIVFDTNVFLSNLEIIEEARDVIFKNYPRPFIVIPWTVICELDHFKDNKSKYELSIKARKAISFIHDQFSSKHPRVIGQTREQAEKNKNDFSLNCPDDEILQCCLQIHQLQKSVVLLSYDKNLCTKAMIYNIMALGRHDSLEKIDYFDMNHTIVSNFSGPVENCSFNEELRLTDDVFEDLKLTMTNFLSTIITKQMSETYGEAEWKIYVIIKPPWSMITALKCAIKHWIAAINESFQRRAEYILKELQDAFAHVPVGGRQLESVEYILEKSSDLIQAINMDKHSNLMTQTFNIITQLKEKYKKYVAHINLKKLHDKMGIAENVQEQEMRAEKVFQSFQYIYNYARDLCGLACISAGMAYSFTFNSMDPLIPQASVQRLQSEITRKVIDLTQNLKKLLEQTEDSIKHQMLLILQENLNTFLPDTAQRIAFDVTSLDIYYCIKLKKEPLKTGLRQLQELTSHFCALAVQT